MSGEVERRYLLVIAAASTVLAALAMAFVDKPAALWIAAHDQSPLWNWLIGILEYPAGIAPWSWTPPIVLVAGVLLALAVVRWRRHARAWMYVAIVYLLTRNLMGWSKTLTGRYRPSQWVLIGGSTFGHVGDGVAFPSGHVTVFGGLVLPIVMIEPRARPLLALIPFVMIARVAVLAHFVSDVLAGLALTSLVAWAFAPLLANDGPARP
jgi:membrane-associated phospholipid phosphatase